MPRSLDFILGLLDRSDPAWASGADFGGPHAEALRIWQRYGFLAERPEAHPAPSCPSCGEGTICRVGEDYLCGQCLDAVDPTCLLLWRFDLRVVLEWISTRLGIDGDIRRVDDSLWQLGSVTHRGTIRECFFRRTGSLGDAGRGRLAAFRNALLLEAIPGASPVAGFQGTCRPLRDVLVLDGDALGVVGVPQLLASAGAVRFDGGTGGVWAGDTWLGEVSVGSREYHFLACLARELDRFVPYEDLKYEVLRHTGSRDTTDDATFCQKLKSRVKKSVPDIDRLIVTTNKGDGYRLCGRVEL
jgi:hypothetical protein